MRDTAAEALGKTSGKSGKKEETWWWDEEVQQAVASKREMKKERDLNRCEETAVLTFLLFKEIVFWENSLFLKNLKEIDTLPQKCCCSVWHLYEGDTHLSMKGISEARFDGNHEGEDATCRTTSRHAQENEPRVNCCVETFTTFTK